MSGKTKKKNIAERLFYTFGSIFLAAIIAVCVINYGKDGRAAQAAFLPAKSPASDGQNTVSATKTSKDSAATNNSNVKATGKTTSKTPVEQSQAPTPTVPTSTPSSSSSDSSSTVPKQTVTAEP